MQNHAAKDLSVRDLLLAPCHGQVSSNSNTRVSIEDQDKAEKSQLLILRDDDAPQRGDPFESGNCIEHVVKGPRCDIVHTIP